MYAPHALLSLNRPWYLSSPLNSIHLTLPMHPIFCSILKENDRTVLALFSAVVCKRPQISFDSHRASIYRVYNISSFVVVAPLCLLWLFTPLRMYTPDMYVVGREAVCLCIVVITSVEAFVLSTSFFLSYSSLRGNFF